MQALAHNGFVSAAGLVAGLADDIDNLPLPPCIIPAACLLGQLDPVHLARGNAGQERENIVGLG